MIAITEVKVKRINSERVKGIARIILNNCIAINDIKIIERGTVMFIAMPSRLAPNGEFKDIVCLIGADTRKIIQDAILKEYEKNSQLGADNIQFALCYTKGWEKYLEDKSWIKLYRKILKSPIWENEKALKVWIWCLVKATHEDRIQLVGQQKVLLEKGQFVFRQKEGERRTTDVRKYGLQVYKSIKRTKNVRHQIEQQIFSCNS